VVTRVLVFHRRGGVGAHARLTRELRREQYDWALDLQGLARSAGLLALARAGRKAGRADAREGARWLYPQKPALPPAGAKAHALEILLNFLPLLGLNPELRGPLCWPAAPAGTWPEGLLAAQPVVLAPDSRRPEKEWGGFVELTSQLLQRWPEQVFVWAGRAGPEPELDWPEERFVNLLGRTTLEHLPDLFAASRLVIANDSGPMHLAAALERTVCALFGPTEPARFGPYPLDNPKHHILRAPGGNLKNLTVDAVLAAVAEALGAG
jgi:ADP-heptose:LPS heptosyltransferase